MKTLLSKKFLIVAAVCVLTPLFFFAPILLGRALFLSGSDLQGYYYPMFDFYSNALQSGQSFLWVPYIFSGFPAYLSQAAGFFDPLNIFLFSIWSGMAGLEIRLIIDLALTFACSYLAARALGASRIASLLVGPSYILAFDWLYLSNPIITNTLFLLPLLMWCVTRAFETQRIRWRFVVLAGAGLGWAILGGYTQLVFYAIFFVVLYALLYLWWVVRVRGWLPWAKVIAAAVLAAALGVCIGLPQVLPAAKFLPLTSRADVSSYSDITLKVINPGDLMLSLVPPDFYIPYVTPGRKPLYVGALWMLLGVGALVWSLAILRRGSAPERTRMLGALVSGLFLFAFIAALQWSPLYWLLSKLPIFSLFRFPFRFMFLGAFFLSLLGALGFDHAQEIIRSRAFRMFAYLVAALSALFAAGVVIIDFSGAAGSSLTARLIYFLFAHVLQGRAGFHKDPSQYQAAVLRGLDAYRELLSLANFAVLLPMIALLAGTALMVLYVRGTLTLERFRSGALFLTIATVLGVAAGGWSAFAPRSMLTTPDPFAAVVSAGPYRTYSFLTNEAALPFIPPQYKLSAQEASAEQELAQASEVPNTNMLHRVPSIDGYDQFEPSATLASMEQVGGVLAAGYGGASDDERRAMLEQHAALLASMGDKYVITGAPLRGPHYALVSTSSVTSYGMTLYLYENDLALPMYFLGAAGCANCAQAGGSLTVARAANGYWEFQTQASAARTLVLLESNVPGWRVTLDGSPAAARHVNGLYMGVDVPAGQHTVTFEYEGMLGELSVLRALRLVR